MSVAADRNLNLADAGSVQLGWSQRKQRRRAVPDSTLFILAIAVPLVAALAVASCIAVWAQQLDGPHFMLGLLTFLAAGQICSPDRIAAVVRETYPGWRLKALFRILLQWSIAVGVGLAGFHLLGLRSALNSSVLWSVVLSVPIVLWFCELALDVFATQSAPKPKDKAVIVGLTDIGAQWEARLAEDPSLGTRVVAYFDDRQESRTTVAHTAKRAGSLADLQSFVRENGIRTVYITLPISRHARLQTLLDELGDSTVSVYFVPDIYAFDLIQPRVEEVHGMALLAVRESPFHGPAAIVKRAIDIGVSAGALLLSAVPMLLIALAIKLNSRGPVIFKQLRYGLNGENIWIYKFRTMTVTETGTCARDYTQVKRGDSRVTAVGKILRATSLDELPQLFNVLEGSMSIVGPRPHVLEVNEKYRRLIPSYMLRHKVRPGITGLAQIRGYRGGDDLPSMTKRVEADLAYLRNWSLTLDLKIIALTLFRVWTDRQAF